jgi:hypothetical protein
MKPVTTISKGKAARINDLVGKLTGKQTQIKYFYETDQIVLFIKKYGFCFRNGVWKNRWHWIPEVDVRRLTMCYIDYIKYRGDGEKGEQAYKALCPDERLSFRKVVYGGKV